MRLYNQQHQYYCGVDLHARTMYVHILDHAGKVVFDRDLPANPAAFRDAIAPFRDGLVVGCECMFAWYWLADLCEDDRIPFVLGHALYMKMIHGGKAKNDRLDAAKLAAMLRGGLFPMAYVYPRAKRATRDLLRRRSHFVQHRAQLITHIHLTNSQRDAMHPDWIGYPAPGVCAHTPGSPHCPVPPPEVTVDDIRDIWDEGYLPS